MLRFEIYFLMTFAALIAKREEISLTLTLKKPLFYNHYYYYIVTTFHTAIMAPLKRYRSATLAKSPPGSPIRLTIKRSRQKTLELPTIASASTSTSTILPLPLRPTKTVSTSTPNTFNSS